MFGGNAMNLEVLKAAVAPVESMGVCVAAASIEAVK